MAKEVIVASLGNKPLWVIQNAKNPKEMSGNLITRYEASSTANRINLLTSLINTRFQARKDLFDYIAELESNFNRLAIMIMPVAEKMQVAILLVSLMNEESLKSTVAELKQWMAIKIHATAYSFVFLKNVVLSEWWRFQILQTAACWNLLLFEPNIIILVRVVKTGTRLDISHYFASPNGRTNQTTKARKYKELRCPKVITQTVSFLTLVPHNISTRN